MLCSYPRSAHGKKLGQIGSHAFVVPAPQPPADATPKDTIRCVVCGKVSPHPAPGTGGTWRCAKPECTFGKPSAQPVVPNDFCIHHGMYHCPHHKSTTFDELMAALRNPAVSLGDLDVCKQCLSVESPYLHSLRSPCPVAATAGPPVTGDGDASPSQLYWELVDIDDMGTWKDLVRSVLDRCYAAGLARGRELGARDENEKCERLVRDAVVEASMAKNGKLALALHNLADAIARRAGREE
jgi:hypothetical protein